jgi:signal transduction histidine kinase
MRDRQRVHISAHTAKTDETDAELTRDQAQELQALRESEERYREYSRRLIEVQEGERCRLSRELHDQVGQILTAVKMNLHALRQKCSAPEILSSIEHNIRVIDEVVDQVRDLSVDLRPSLLDDLGLVVAVRWYLDRQAKSWGVPAHFTTCSLSDDDRFSSELETACFRIVQEALTNVARHAQASRISVVLERAGQDLVLLISDDGAGFDIKALRTNAATVGLRSMEERVQAVGGSLTIDSAPDLGTAICARFPIPYPPQEAQKAQTVLMHLCLLCFFVGKILY